MNVKMGITLCSTSSYKLHTMDGGVRQSRTHRVEGGGCGEEEVGMVMCLGVGGESDALHYQLNVELSLRETL